MTLKEILKEDLTKLLEVVKKLRETHNTYALEGYIETALRTDKTIEFWTYSSDSSLCMNLLVAIKDYKERYYSRYFIFGNNDDLLHKLLDIVIKNDNLEKIIFEDVSEEHWKLVNLFFEKNGYLLQLETHPYTYVADSDSIKTCCNKFGYLVNELTVEETEYINNQYEYNLGELTYSIIHDGIKYNVSLAVRNSENEPIAYEIIQLNRSMSQLMTNEKYRGQGLGSFVMTTLARKVLESQDFVHAYITVENEVSAYMHKKSGFICKPSCMVFSAVFMKKPPLSNS